MATIKKNKVIEARVRKEKGCIEAALERVRKVEVVQNRATVFEAKGLQLKREALTIAKKEEKADADAHARKKHKQPRKQRKTNLLLFPKNFKIILLFTTEI